MSKWRLAYRVANWQAVEDLFWPLLEDRNEVANGGLPHREPGALRRAVRSIAAVIGAGVLFAACGSAISPKTSTGSTTTTAVRSSTTTAPPGTAITTRRPTKGDWTCTATGDQGICRYPSDTYITGPLITGKPYDGQNIWNPISGYSQTLHANSPENFEVIARGPTNNTAVVAYPNSGVDADNTALVNRSSSIISTFSETMPHNRRTVAWAMYDLWFNNWKNEVMIQYDFDQPSWDTCNSVADAQFGGSSGVPRQTWHLCDFGRTLDWKLGPGSRESSPPSESSGSVNILAMIKWLENHGYLPPRSTWTALSNGWEICSTGGVNESFTMNSYTLKAS